MPQLLANRHVIDEHHWWLNTDDEDDIAHIESVSARHPDFFRICRKPYLPGLELGPNIWKFFRDYADPNTLYMRFDDDICYMADGAVEAMVRYRIDHPEPLLVLGNIVNNAVCTHFHQAAGLVPRAWGLAGNLCMDRMGWIDPGFARRLHSRFLEDVAAGQVARWRQVAIPITGVERFSINAICWRGSDLAAVPELALDDVDEEPFLTEELPRRMGRPNRVCPEVLFAHFAFYTQRPLLERFAGGLLDGYRAVSRGRPLPCCWLARRAFHRVRMTSWHLAAPFRTLGGLIWRHPGNEPDPG